MYSSRGSGGYGQSYTSQSAYAQNVSGFIFSVLTKFNAFLIDFQFFFRQDLHSLKINAFLSLLFLIFNHGIYTQFLVVLEFVIFQYLKPLS